MLINFLRRRFRSSIIISQTKKKAFVGQFINEFYLKESNGFDKGY